MVLKSIFTIQYARALKYPVTALTHYFKKTKRKLRRTVTKEMKKVKAKAKKKGHGQVTADSKDESYSKARAVFLAHSLLCRWLFFQTGKTALALKKAYSTERRR